MMGKRSFLLCLSMEVIGFRLVRLCSCVIWRLVEQESSRVVSRTNNVKYRKKKSLHISLFFYEARNFRSLMLINFGWRLV